MEGASKGSNEIVTDSKHLDLTFKSFSNKFLKTTSLHVLDNICSNSSPKVGRFVYLIILILLILLSSYYTAEIYTKWCNSPVLLAESTVGIPITAVAFPAITICNLNQAKRSVAEKIERHTWDYIRLKVLCKFNTDVSFLNETKATQWTAFREFILNTIQTCEEMILVCRYGSVSLNCNDIFEMILTDQGVCCSFNALHPDFVYTGNSMEKVLDKDKNYSIRTPVRFTAEHGYQPNLPEEFYPRRILGTGVAMGFSVVINASLNEYYCSSSRNSGFKILLHASSEVPRVADYALLIPTKYESRVEIKPVYRTTAEDVRKLPVRDRNCLYNSESNLKYFQVYSSVNCELECTANIMEEECGCVQIYLPKRSNETLICGLRDIQCAQRVEREVINLVKPKGKCAECRWSCSYFDFPGSASRSRLLSKDPMLDELFPAGYNINELSVVHFYHSHRRMSVTRMEAYLGFLNFFSNSGGIYSLFLGFSILSLIELVYFAILLLVKVIKWQRKRKQADAVIKSLPKIIYCVTQEDIFAQKGINGHTTSKYIQL